MKAHQLGSIILALIFPTELSVDTNLRYGWLEDYFVIPLPIFLSRMSKSLCIARWFMESRKLTPHPDTVPPHTHYFSTNGTQWECTEVCLIWYIVMSSLKFHVSRCLFCSWKWLLVLTSWLRSGNVTKCSQFSHCSPKLDSPLCGGCGHLLIRGSV